MCSLCVQIRFWWLDAYLDVLAVWMRCLKPFDMIILLKATSHRSSFCVEGTFTFDRQGQPQLYFRHISSLWLRGSIRVTHGIPFGFLVLVEWGW